MNLMIDPRELEEIVNKLEQLEEESKELRQIDVVRYILGHLPEYEPNICLISDDNLKLGLEEVSKEYKCKRPKDLNNIYFRIPIKKIIDLEELSKKLPGSKLKKEYSERIALNRIEISTDQKYNLTGIYMHNPNPRDYGDNLRRVIETSSQVYDICKNKGLTINFKANPIPN